MSEQDNLQTVQRAYKAFIEGDLPAILNLVTDDVEFLQTVSKIPWAHPWRGRHGVEQYFRTLTEALEFQVFQADEFIVAGDSVVALGHERCRVRATGRVVEVNWAQVFTLRNGMISRHREYVDTAAWEAGCAGADV